MVNGETPKAVCGRRAGVMSLTRAEDLLLTDASAVKAAVGSPTAGDDLLSFVRRQTADATVSAEKVANLGRDSSDASYPANALGQKLQLVSRLLKAGSAARVYYTAQGGYDTHAQQFFTHRTLCSEFAGSVAAFFTDLSAAKLDERVVLFAFSEFGRTIQENASGGTDHGTAGCAFIVGPGVKGGIHGSSPSLTELDRGEPKMTTGFRRVHTAILTDWLKLPATNLGGLFEGMKLFG